METLKKNIVFWLFMLALFYGMDAFLEWTIKPWDWEDLRFWVVMIPVAHLGITALIDLIKGK